MKKIAVVLVVLVALLVNPVVALADSDTVTTTITGAISSSIDITAPTDISDWSLLIGDNSRSGTLGVSCNTNWNVAVKDNLDDSKPSGTEGKMAEWSGSDYPTGGDVLTNALKLQITGESEVTLSDTATDLWGSNQAAYNGNKTVYFNQTIDTSDTMDQTFRIIVTFIGTTY